MPIFKCLNCGPTEPCKVEIEMKPRLCLVSDTTEPNWVKAEPNLIILEINGQRMAPETYGIVHFLDGNIKVAAVFNEAPVKYIKEE